MKKIFLSLLASLNVCSSPFEEERSDKAGLPGVAQSQIYDFDTRICLELARQFVIEIPLQDDANYFYKEKNKMQYMLNDFLLEAEHLEVLLDENLPPAKRPKFSNDLSFKEYVEGRVADLVDRMKAADITCDLNALLFHMTLDLVKHVSQQTCRQVHRLLQAKAKIYQALEKENEE